MRLLGDLVVRVAVGVDGLVELLVRHERVDELVVGVQQAAEPLLVFDVVNLAKGSSTSVNHTFPVFAFSHPMQSSATNEDI